MKSIYSIHGATNPEYILLIALALAFVMGVFSHTLTSVLVRRLQGIDTGIQTAGKKSVIVLADAAEKPKTSEESESDGASSSGSGSWSDWLGGQGGFGHGSGISYGYTPVNTSTSPVSVR